MSSNERLESGNSQGEYVRRYKFSRQLFLDGCEKEAKPLATLSKELENRNRLTTQDKERVFIMAKR